MVDIGVGGGVEGFRHVGPVERRVGEKADWGSSLLHLLFLLVVL
jgi:hypothetical protein